MAGRRELDQSADACPFAPGSSPPKKGSFDGLLNVYDGFFGNWKLVTLSLVVTSLILMYSIASVSAPMVSLPSTPATWSIPGPKIVHSEGWAKARVAPRFDDVTVHEGDLILDGSDVLLIEDETFILGGKLYVMDEASVVLRNAELLLGFKIESTQQVAYHIDTPGSIAFFYDSSTLEAVDSSIACSGKALTIVLNGQSQWSVSNSDLSRANLALCEEASLEMTGSDVSRLGAGGDASADLLDCNVDWIGPTRAYKLGSWTDCSLRLAGSDVKLLELEFRDDARVLVSRQILGHHGLWNTYLNASEGGSAFNVTLEDTTISDQVTLRALDGDMEVRGLEGNYLLYGGRGALEVRDCVVNVVSASDTRINNSVCYLLSLSDDDESLVVDSRIDNVHYHGFRGTARYENVKIGRASYEYDCDGYIEGTITYAKDYLPYERWGSSGLTRTYEVIAHDEGRALGSVSLSLFGDEGEVLWNGETNDEGIAEFTVRLAASSSAPSLTYPDALQLEYGEPLRLEAHFGNQKQKVNVAFDSDTPLVFTFDPVNFPLHFLGRSYLTVVSGSFFVVIVLGYALSRTRDARYFLFDA